MNAVVMIVNGIVLVPLYFKFMSISAYGAWLATGNVVGVFGLMEMGRTWSRFVTLAEIERELPGTVKGTDQW